ncbi:hypothetical protein LXA43DRAFT_1058566 [Ganoderma leucocontextum]|nr:hypothetical protein LXA43DRAFT_1058566 [Ganoderma leucocontextum]
MWLLITDRAELHYFASPGDVEDGYAILSHVWWIQTVPQDWSFWKIRECCILAAKHGYKWLWVDTCCIDKTSSTELSEAINSMFRYYQRARVCYVYLYDVAVSGSQGEITGPNPAFRESRWHGRGWTLQELLAPEFVAFYSRDWQPLGSKTDLAPLLEHITGIPRSVLTLQTHLADISQRMGWAAKRKTTRPEDEAYCLMGIFHVNMPLLYGEGSKAFLRLQEEIMKQSQDTTLFSWTHTWGAPLSLEYPARLNSSQGLPGTLSKHTHDADDIAMYLFAPSPKEPMASTVSGSSRRLANFPTFSATPYGVLAHIPVIELQGAQVLIALLGWTTSSGKRYGLLLTRPTTCRTSQQAVCGFGLLDQPLPAPRWMDVCLLQKPSLDDIGARAGINSLPLAVLTCGLTSPFRFVRRDLDGLQAGKKSGASMMNLHSISCDNLELPWTGLDCPMTFTFAIRDHGAPDSAAYDPSLAAEAGMSTIVARTSFSKSAADQERASVNHECSVDHIREWPNWKKTTVIVPSSAESYEYCLDLSFSECPMNPTSLKGAIAIVPLNVVLSASSSSSSRRTESLIGSKLRRLERKSRGQNHPMGFWEYFEDEAPTPAETSWSLEDHEMELWVPHENLYPKGVPLGRPDSSRRARFTIDWPKEAVERNEQSHQELQLCTCVELECQVTLAFKPWPMNPEEVGAKSNSGYCLVHTSISREACQPHGAKIWQAF